MRASRTAAVMACFAALAAAAVPGCGAERRENDNGITPANGEKISLPAARQEGEVSLEAALAARRSRRSFGDGPLTLEAAAQLLWAAQGITDSRRGFRAAPSAGATFPLETYLVAGDVTGLEPGVYRYRPAEHALEPVRAGDIREALAAAAHGQTMVARAPATIAFAAVYRRTADRYGARAERYVHMEIGHAGQNVYLQAEALGLGTVAVGAFRDEAAGEALGITAPLRYLLPVGRRP